MTTAQTALAKLASAVHDPAGSLQTFGLPERRLFPVDDSDLTRASVVAFDVQARKLSCSEKIACARVITKAANEQRIENRGLAAKLASTSLSPLFNTFMNMRAESCAWHADAMKDINMLKSLGEKIADVSSATVREAMLSKLAHRVEAFDGKWDRTGIWAERGMPDAAYSVLGTTLNVDDKLPAVDDAVKVASRAVRITDLSDENVVKAEAILGKEKIATLLKATDRLAEFRGWDHPHQELLVSFLPEVRA